MIKLTAGQASAFNSNHVASLFADKDRPFPITDAFRLSDLVKQIQDKLKMYNDQVRKAIEKNNGKIEPTGIVHYPTPEDQEKAQKEIDKLNAVEIEITGKKVVMKETWPNLSLAEATILRVLIDEPKQAGEDR